MASPPNASPSIHETIGRAMHLAQTGQLDEAERLYRAVLSREPNHPHVLHFLGLLRHERGATAEGVTLLERAVEVDPQDLDLRNNLANLYLLVGRQADAEAAFRSILAAEPGRVATRFNLGALLLRSRRFTESVDELSQVARLVREPDVYRELGEALLASERFEAAVEAFRLARALRPDDPALRKRLSHAYFRLVDSFDRKLEDPAAALVHIERWVELDPDDPIAQHTLAAYSGRAIPERCSPGYVKRTFDLFADSFDDVLGALGYAGVRRSAAALEAAFADRNDAGKLERPERVVLDAGCGTGALGPLIRASCARLVGVDLSPKMVEKALARGAYDAVEEADLVEWLGRHVGEHDAIVSADTVVYFGDVTAFFEAAVKALKPGGCFIFTAEALEPCTADSTFHLDRHGRYSHAEPYLARVVESAGAVISHVEHLPAIRVEYGLNVPGLIVTAVRRDGPDERAGS